MRLSARQILRSLTVLSLLVLLAESCLLEWLFHADALLTDAALLQRTGHPEAAIQAYMHVLKRFNIISILDRIASKYRSLATVRGESLLFLRACIAWSVGAKHLINVVR